MSIHSKTPLALYKANLELVLRLGALLQENRRRWTEFGASNTREAIERTMAETERVLTANDWSSLAAMPGEEFWKSLREEGAPLQASVESAIGNQAAFAQGLKEAFEAWRQQSADALGASGDALIGPSFADFLKDFTPAGARPRAARQPEPASAPKAKAKATPKSGSKARATPRAAAKSRKTPRARK